MRLALRLNSGGGKRQTVVDILALRGNVLGYQERGRSCVKEGNLIEDCAGGSEEFIDYGDASKETAEATELRSWGCGAEEDVQADEKEGTHLALLGLTMDRLTADFEGC